MKMTVKEILERAEAGDKVSLEAEATWVAREPKEGESQHGPWSVLRVGLTGDDGGKIWANIWNKGDLQPPSIQKGDRLTLSDVRVDEGRKRGDGFELRVAADQVIVNGDSPAAVAPHGPPAARQQSRDRQPASGGGGRPEPPSAQELSDLWVWHYTRAVDAGATPEAAGGGATSLCIARSENRCTSHYASPPAQEREPGGDDGPPLDDDDVPFAWPLWFLTSLPALAGLAGVLA